MFTVYDSRHVRPLPFSLRPWRAAIPPIHFRRETATLVATLPTSNSTQHPLPRSADWIPVESGSRVLDCCSAPSFANSSPTSRPSSSGRRRSRSTILGNSSPCASPQRLWRPLLWARSRCLGRFKLVVRLYSTLPILLLYFRSLRHFMPDVWLSSSSRRRSQFMILGTPASFLPPCDLGEPLFMPWTSFHTLFPHSFHPIPQIPGASASQAPTSRSAPFQVCSSILLGTPDTSTLSSVPSYNLIPCSSCHSKLDVSAVFLSASLREVHGRRLSTFPSLVLLANWRTAVNASDILPFTLHSSLTSSIRYLPSPFLVLPPHKSRPTPRNTLRTARPRFGIVASATDGAHPWPFCHMRAIPWTWTRWPIVPIVHLDSWSTHRVYAHIVMLWPRAIHHLSLRTDTCISSQTWSGKSARLSTQGKETVRPRLRLLCTGGGAGFWMQPPR
ncbi:hypothetical protein NUW54_g13445 [Trametes sanguinea]|uniref:Uncharacterized protein n=1 Tax=Trametes sanguinea TaxID=158606 RepID=A0ACC1MMZ4_9APHY|nr:hypothetical protein NUW54_g13445 [Trametes sanguinea]